MQLANGNIGCTHAMGINSPCVIASVAAGVACADELMREAGCEVVATAAGAAPVAPFSSVPLASPRSTSRCRRTRIFSSF